MSEDTIARPLAEHLVVSFLTTNVDANRTFQSMVIVYGFFFILQSAVATMTPNVVSLHESEVFDLTYRTVALYS